MPQLPAQSLDATPASRLRWPADRIADFCRRWKIRELSLFGSALRDDFGPASDVDLLVEFQPGTRTGLAFFGLQDELSAAIGRTVDLNTAGFLGPRILPGVSLSPMTSYASTGSDLPLVLTVAEPRAGRLLARLY